MPCKIEIRKKIEDSVEQLTDSVKGSSLRLANKKAKEVNDSFRAKVVQFDANEGGLERSIFIPGSLIQIYYDNELEIEKQEAARLLKEEEEQERKYVESKKEEWEENREYFENDEPFTRVSDANTQIQKKLQELYPEINLNITNKPVWEQGNDVLNQEEYDKEVAYRLKAVEILLSDKAKQIFEKGNKNNWDLNKILTELAVSKDQKQLILDSGKTNIEDIITNLLANYSYAVEINTAKTNINSGGAAVQELDDLYIPSLRETFYFSYRDGWFKEDKNQDRIIATPEELKIIEEYKNKDAKQNSSFYSNLTVPGGTNYTENEIATPGQLIEKYNEPVSIKLTSSGITTDGNYDERSYSIFKENKKIGYILLPIELENKNDLNSIKTINSVELVGLDKEERGKKYALSAYKQLITELSKEGIKLSTNVEFITKGSKGVWDDLVKEGFAVEKNGDYISTNKTLNKTEERINSITPSIKGHAQFATDKGIGWFRSDDKISEQKKEFSDLLNKNRIEDAEKLDELRKTKDLPTKTRRILEVQSDLFQKLRNNFKFRGIPHNIIIPADNNGEKVYLINEEEVSASTYNKAFEDFIDAGGDNQFLALLHKGDNWVTFFVKSIIQDSAKKGYEKVLFPTGNTASKVEGHTTLEEFKKQQEGRIKELEKRISNLDKDIQDDWVIKEKEKTNTEINQLKQELETVEKEGFGALKPIFNFYENTVTNILNKQYGKENVNQVTDEYGNTWNEITINQARELQNVLLQKNEANRIIGQANIKAMSVLVDAVNKKEDTLPHEYAHHYIAWFRNTPIVQEAIKKWGSEEALVQSIGEQVVKQKGEAYDWWKKFTDYIMDLFNNLSTKDKQELTNILTDAFLSGIDLENNNVGISRERSKELASKASGIFNQEEPIKPGVEELFDSNFLIFAESKTSDEVISKLLSNKIIDKKCN